MEIKEEVKKKSFRTYNESLGVALSKKNVIKSKKIPFLGYVEKLFFLFVLCFCISIFILIIDDNLEIIAEIFCFIASILIVLIISRVALFFLRPRKIFKTIINEEGITDESFYNLKILITWDKVKAVVIKKHSISILTDTPIYLYFDSTLKDKIINCLKKYHKEDLIIE